MSNTKKRKNRKRIITPKRVMIFAFAIVVLLYYLHYERIITLPSWLEDEVFDPISPPAEGSAQVHFIDVGQGDCELIISDDGTTVLIDGGEEICSPDVASYLHRLGISRLDYIITSHPHSDHIGALPYVIRKTDEVGKVIMPKIPDEYVPTSTAYENLLKAISDKGCKAEYAEDKTISLGSGSMEIKVPDYDGDNLNDYSIIVKFTFGSRKFLFCGDLEWDMEQSIRKSGYDLSADVYKLSHHGSSTSNQILWLKAVSPDYCVCECGAGNNYGHPHSEVVQAVEDIGAVLLRTDINGTVVFETDGETLEYKTER